MNKNKLARTIIITFIAALCIGISINLYMKAGIGSDCITVFEEGLHKSLGISLGWASVLYSVIFFGTAAFFAREYVGLNSIHFSLFVGPSIDLLTPIFDRIPSVQSLWIQMIFVMLAVVFIALSATLLIVEGSGMNPYDSIATWISDQTGKSYKLIRTIMDVSLLLIGWLLGGQVGIGTILASLTTGILISYFVQTFKKVVK